MTHKMTIKAIFKLKIYSSVGFAATSPNLGEELMNTA